MRRLRVVFRRLAPILLASGALSLVACSHSAGGGGNGADGGDYSVPVPIPTATAPGIPCADGGDGCPCGVPGLTQSCKAQELHIGSYIACAGTRVCRSDGTWSTCAPSLNLQQADGGIAPASR